MPTTSSRVRADIAASLPVNIPAGKLLSWHVYAPQRGGGGGCFSFASNSSDYATDTSGTDPGEEKEGEL